MRNIIKQRLLPMHPGWTEHEDSDRKTHYFIIIEGDWYIAICGELLPDRDLANRLKKEYTCNVPTENYCKRCLKKYKQLQNGESVTTTIQGMLY